MIKATEVIYVEEFETFCSLGRQFQEECEPLLPFDDKEAYVNLFTCVEDIQRKNLNAWIVRKDDAPIGLAVGRMSKYLFSSQRIASMLFWYVQPEHRKTRASFELLHTFENWATLNGAYRIEVGAARQGVDEVNAINRMFTKRGFKAYGELFYRDLV